jgi:uncharacterized membrane protein
MERITLVWQQAKSSLWFLPGIFVFIAIILATVLPYVDQNVSLSPENEFWLFYGSPSAARTLLSTIAAAVITVISIAFSLTMIAIQQAATQYTPRVLRTFTSNMGNQLVLGSYLATFVYSLLVLRVVRESGDDGVESFVPYISVTVSVVLVLFCIALLVYFINHVAKSLQDVAIITRVHKDLRQQLKKLHPGTYKASRPGQKPLRRSGNHTAVWSKSFGFVDMIDERILKNVETEGVKLIEITACMGDFVAEGDEVASIYADKHTDTEALADVVERAIILSKERSTTQDALFAVRQLADIGVKSLSSGINGQTTAEYCIRYLGDALSYLAGREFPPALLDLDNRKMRIMIAKPDWETYVLTAFGQIRNEAKTKPHVILELLGAIERLAYQIPSKERVDPLSSLVADIASDLLQQEFAPSDKKRLSAQMRVTLAALDAAPRS